MRRFVFAFLIAAAAPLLMAGQPVAPHHLVVGDADGTALDAASAYLNGMTTLKGGFIQVSPSGAVDEGMFYISKPGKMRFEYNPPAPTLIVSDGETLAVANKRLNTVDSYSLSDTPLGLLLDRSVDIRHDPRLFSVAHRDGTLVVGLKTFANRPRANITLVFSEPGYELRQWVVIDDQGLSTTVAVRNVVPGAVLPPSLFVLPQKAPPR